MAALAVAHGVRLAHSTASVTAVAASVKQTPPAATTTTAASSSRGFGGRGAEAGAAHAAPGDTAGGRMGEARLRRREFVDAT
jgi:hypothetical protein